MEADTQVITDTPVEGAGQEGQQGAPNEQQAAPEFNFEAEFETRYGHKTIDEYVNAKLSERESAEDPFIRDLKAYKTGWDLGEFQRLSSLKSLDIEKLTPEETIRHHLAHSKGLTGADLNEAYEAHLYTLGSKVDTGKLEAKVVDLDAKIAKAVADGEDPESFAEKKEALLEQIADGTRRNKAIDYTIKEKATEAAKYLSEHKSKVKFPDPSEAAQQKQQSLAKLKSDLSSYSAGLKEVSFGDVGGKPFAFTIGAENKAAVEKANEMTAQFYDNPYALFQNEKGETDPAMVHKFFLLSQLTPDALAAAVTRGSDKGKESVIKPHQNPSNVNRDKPFVQGEVQYENAETARLMRETQLLRQQGGR